MKIRFLKNEPENLLKTKDEPKKRTGNEAKTDLAMLLKTNKWPEKRSENEPKNKAKQLIENKGQARNEPEIYHTSDKRRFSAPGGHWTVRLGWLSVG